MKPAEHIAKSASTPKAGLVATLCAFLHVKGSGATKVGRGCGGSKASRRLILPVLATTLGLLLLAAPAAEAGIGYRFSFSFAEAVFSEPKGLAVDDSANPADSSKGDVYVVRGEFYNTLTKFSIADETATELWSVSLPEGARQATVDDYAGAEEGDVYVAGYGSGVISQVTPAGAVTEVLSGLVNPADVAVDAAGDFFVLLGSEGEVLEYNSKWEPIDAAGGLVSAGANTVVEPHSGAQALAVSSSGEDVYIATGTGALHYELSAGAYAEEAALDANASTGVTIAPSGDVFVDQGSEVVEYESSGVEVLRFGAGVLADGFGVGVYGSEAYVADFEDGRVDAFAGGPTPELPETLPATAVLGNSAVLHGDVKLAAGETKAKYYFEYSMGASCAGGAKTSVREGSEKASEEVKALTVATRYTFCLHVQNKFGEATGGEESFETAAVGQEDSPTVSQSEAEVTAEIGTAGAPTTYSVQYGMTGVEESSTPVARVPAASAPVEVQQRLASLRPATTYRFRFAVDNGHGLVTGEERTFTTPAPPSISPAETQCKESYPSQLPRGGYSAALPNCRAYELVSPEETNGQDATGSSRTGEARAAASGEAMTFGSKGSFAGAAGAVIQNQFLSRREPVYGRWSTQSITPPYAAYESNPGSDYETMAFTPELSEGLATTDTELASETREGVYQLYLDDFVDDSYRLVSSVSSGAKPFQGYFSPTVEGASTDLSHVVFGMEGALYEWANGRARLVGVAPNGDPISASAGAAAAHGASNPNKADRWHSVSADGSRVIFTSPYIENNEQEEHTLYVRENAEQEQSPVEHAGEPDEGCTDQALACTISIAAGARFWGANAGLSSEGSKVFYTKHGDLYEYDLPLGTSVGTTTDLAPGGEVQGVAQISEDGAYVYFVARGVLTHGPNAEGKEPAAGQPNLYVFHAGTGLTFVTTLAPEDKADWSAVETTETDTEAGPITNRAVITPDGTRLAFESGQRLTGYDNEQAGAGECENPLRGFGALENAREAGKCRELYLYDAETGMLVCASCNPSGARPIGPSTISSAGLEDAEYRPRNLLANGVLFFDSEDALVPSASDGRQNVYEYEGGQIYAISDVAGEHESFFLDASANGENVFFGTADKLLARDLGNRVAVYDARVGGGLPEPVSPPPCDNGDSCRPPASPQPTNFGASGSATFSGVGNFGPSAPAAIVKAKPLTRGQKLAGALKLCRRDKKKAKRQSCEKRAKKKYGQANTNSKNSKRARNGRRTTR